MKNMRSFSVTASLVFILLFSSPVVAMDGPEFDFTKMAEGAREQFDRAKQGLQNGINYVGQQVQKSVETVKDFYNPNAPKAENSVPKVEEADLGTNSNNFLNRLEGSKELQSQNPVEASATLITSEIPVAKVPTSTLISVAVPGVPVAISKTPPSQVIIATPVKNYGTQLKEAIQKHPIITGVVVAAVIAVPLVIFWLKLQKTKKSAVRA
jgi:hypothetical protein